jgi:hypothetical protein
MNPVYIDSKGAIRTPCPESFADINVWVWCLKCPSYRECFGDATWEDILEEAKKGS